MKNGKIILSAVAAIVTVSSALALKIAIKFTTGKIVFAMTANSIVNGTCPVTCRSLRTTKSGCKHLTTCVTKNGENIGVGGGPNHNTFYTAIGPNRTCISPVTCLHKSL